jgi:hypothetical protein
MNPNRRVAVRRRLLFALIGFALVGLCGWAIFGRHESALDRWIVEMRAKGEKLTLKEFGLNRSAFTNAAMEVIEVAAARLKALERAKVPVEHQPTEDIGAEHQRVEWAGTNLQSTIGYVLDWDGLGRELTELRSASASVQQIMRDPPLDSGRDYTGTSSSLYIVAMREVAQWVYIIAMYDLHQGDLSLAHQDLLALIGMAHLHAETWNAVDQGFAQPSPVWRRTRFGTRFKLGDGQTNNCLSCKTVSRALQELQPEFLSELPADFYDGKPVRYRIEADGAFTLYSIGADFQDDGGAPGKDLLWRNPSGLRRIRNRGFAGIYFRIKARWVEPRRFPDRGHSGRSA